MIKKEKQNHKSLRILITHWKLQYLKQVLAKMNGLKMEK
jgi:hypothetical protein